jgi:hypothetical protein
VARVGVFGSAFSEAGERKPRKPLLQLPPSTTLHTRYNIDARREVGSKRQQEQA